MQTAVRTALRRGIADIAPIYLGALPFGLVAGLAAVDAGFNEVQAAVMSASWIAGAAQLATIDLIGQQAALGIILATALVINARHLMYSASLAPHWSTLSFGRRALLSFVMLDQSYALGIVRYQRVDEPVAAKAAYFGAIGFSLGAVWVAATLVGAYAGAAVPASWSLDFMIPLIFLALIIPTVTDRPTLAAAATSAAVAVAARPFPLNLGLLTAAAAGIAVGLIVGRHGQEPG